MSCYGFESPSPSKKKVPSTSWSPLSTLPVPTSPTRFDEVLKQQQQSDLMDRIQTLEIENASRKQQLIAYGVETAELNKRVYNFDKLTAEHKLMTKRAEEAETACMQQGRELDDLNADLNITTQRAEAAEKRVEDLISKLAEAQRLRDSVTAQRDAVEAQRKVQDERAKCAEQRNGELKSQLDDANRKLQTATDELGRTQAKQQTTDAQLMAARHTIEEISADCEQAKKENGALKLSFRAAEEKGSERDREALRTRDELTEQRAQLTKQKEEVRDLREELERIRASKPLVPLATLAPSETVVRSVDAPPPVALPPVGLPLPPLDPEKPSLPNAEFERVIARGGQAVVWQGRYNHLPVVFKIPFSLEKSEDWKNEFDVLREVSVPPADPRYHKNIVPLIASGVGWFVLKFAKGGDLYAYIQGKGALPTMLIKDVATGIAEGLIRLHDKGFIHCDLKSQNVLLNESLIPWITDFGFACRKDSPRRVAKQGTAAYMAPEMIRGEPIGPEIDVYALGVILYEMIAGHMAWRNILAGEGSVKEMEEKIYACVLKGQRPEVLPVWDEKLRRLMASCWDPVPERRMKLAEFVTAMSHVK